MPGRRFRRDNKAAVSIAFAASAIPVIGMLGLAVDVTFVTQAKQQLSLAADTAALAATKTASNEFVSGNTTTYLADGNTNGNQWFNAQLGTLRGAVAVAPSTAVTRNGTTFTTVVTYSGSVPSHFAGIFGSRFNTFAISGSATATITINAYVNITLLLDNSSSMLIGASTSDINTLQAVTACSPMAGGSGQGTNAWNTTLIPATCPTTYATNTSSPGSAAVAGQPPHTAPCGFACHWSADNQTSNGAPDYTQYDYYALARNLNLGPITGYSTPTLRFDVVQQAAAEVVSTMESNEILSNQFGLGVFTFNTANSASSTENQSANTTSSHGNVIPAYSPPYLERIWPAGSTAEASTDLEEGATAITGIVTPVGPNGGDTDFPDAMASLAGVLTTAGDGSTPSAPKKDLFIVTDGIQDYSASANGTTVTVANSRCVTTTVNSTTCGSMGPMNSAVATAACNAIKAKGIYIYVLYTPYSVLSHNPFYVSNIDQFISVGTPNKTVQALESCASAPTDFFEADIPSQVTSGLTNLLQAAIRTPARISS